MSNMQLCYSCQCFLFAQPGVKNFGLGKGQLSLKLLMKLRGLGAPVAWGEGEGSLKRRAGAGLSPLLFDTHILSWTPLCSS